MEPDLESPLPESGAPRPEPSLDVTILIPVSTDLAPMREVIEALGAQLEQLGKSWEVIAVFDGCRGPAWETLMEIAGERPGQVHALAFQQAFGASACLTSGFEQSRGRVVVTSPQYVQVDPAELGRLLGAIEAGADFVTPWRQERVDPWFNRMQSVLFNMLMRRIIKAPFHDLNCYFRAIRREVLEELAIYGDMYRFLPAIAFRQGYKVEELRVRHQREWGASGIFGLGVYMRRFLDVIGVVFLTHFTAKPLRFFGTLGTLFVALGGGLSSINFLQWLFTDDHPLYSRPIFMVGMLLFVLGVQVIGFGLVGEIIIYTQARHMREYRIERIYDK